ncbi:hypothetical protein C7Y66_13175 [Chroococcidiopsis sp. CCALA 051]|uniref:GumC family protein n=1 Tax=Chroococcidiopsis sp. CCALA 051 TaxID=869949 RepID=UPI000D0DFB43|nr:hypothetical protein [Chroococcidiopsis sp. CCALA 051]MBE9014717.1 hypothetical protein [Chroococcidiopsidales cyanobacterium LEGE 13417]PSM48710.1 hypothetical protein C7Y66_13175 [Chroococcidiopsis sp. CCALA 051]
MSIALPKLNPHKSLTNRGRWQFYLTLGLITNATIWISALLYLKFVPPTYTSHSAIAVPGEGSSVNVNLPNIGEASYQNSTPYSGGSTQDPRENYKFIAESLPILKEAAQHLSMSSKQFGKPQIKLVVNSAIMEVNFKGASPQEARNKSLAFYQVFETKLDRIRSQGVTRRNVAFQIALDTSKKKLEIAQKRLSNYKIHSGLNSSERLRELLGTIEQLRRQKAEVLAQQQQANDRLKQISADLNSSAQLVADALTLKTDRVFQQNLKDYSETKAALDVLSSKFLPNAPIVVEQEAKREAAEKALLNQSQFLLGRQISLASLRQLDLSSNSDSAREQLFQQLMIVRADRTGLQGQAQRLDKQIIQFEDRLKKLTEQENTLDALKRDVEVAKAVFSSNLAKLDLGKSNIFGSYPLMEIVTEPTLADTPSWPRQEFVLVGTILCSLFVSTGLGLHWLRQGKTSTGK